MSEDSEGADRQGSDMQPSISLTTIVYALQAAGLVLPICLIVAVIINYVKLPDVTGTWIESHFRWQIRTFWIAASLVLLGVVTLLLVIGYFVLLGTCIWVIYRIVKGWLYLNDRKSLAR
ncbi:MAG: DUF4870 family protein [Acidiferrobacterales bacterium]